MRLRSHEEEEPSIHARNSALEEMEAAEEGETRLAPLKSERHFLVIRVVRVACILFASVGLFAGLTSAITGISLEEWLQQADFKRAYSRANLTYASGMAAVKVGDLPRASKSLLALSPESTEAGELGAALLTPLLEAGDLATGARVARFLNQKSRDNGLEASPAAMLGKAIGSRLGLEKGLAFTGQNPDAAALRPVLLPSLFSAVVGNERSALERLAERAVGSERVSAVETLVSAYQGKRDFKRAWNWTGSLPEPSKSALRSSVLQQWATTDTEAAMRLLETLPVSPSHDQARQSIGNLVVGTDVEAARRIALKMTPGTAREILLKSVADLSGINPPLEVSLARAAELSSREARAGALVSLAVANTRMPARLATILDHLKANARGEATATRLHDDLIRYLVVSHAEASERKRYVARVLDPATRDALAKGIASGAAMKATLNWSGGGASASSSSSSVPNAGSRGVNP